MDISDKDFRQLIIKRVKLRMRDVTQAELAEALDMDPATLSSKLTGRRAITVKELWRIAIVLHCPVEMLFPTYHDLMQFDDYYVF